MGGRIYDLGVLFDDDGKIYAVHGYDEVHLIEIKADFSGYVEGSDRVIIPKGNAMGEGHHFYKINGKYYIISADYSPVGRMQCARADRPEGPYETTVISHRETMGVQQGWWTKGYGFWSDIPDEGDKTGVPVTFGELFQCRPLAPRRYRGFAQRRLVGLLYDGHEIGGAFDLPFARHMEGRLALFRGGRKSSGVRLVRGSSPIRE